MESTLTQRRGESVAVIPPVGQTIHTIARDQCAHLFAVEASIDGGPYTVERGRVWVVTPDGVETVVEAGSFGVMFPRFDRRQHPR